MFFFHFQNNTKIKCAISQLLFCLLVSNKQRHTHTRFSNKTFLAHCRNRTCISTQCEGSTIWAKWVCISLKWVCVCVWVSIHVLHTRLTFLIFYFLILFFIPSLSFYIFLEKLCHVCGALCLCVSTLPPHTPILFFLFFLSFQK